MASVNAGGGGHHPDLSGRDGGSALTRLYDEQARDLRDPTTARILEWRDGAVKSFQGYQAGKAFTSDLVTEAIVTMPGQRP